MNSSVESAPEVLSFHSMSKCNILTNSLVNPVRHVCVVDTIVVFSLKLRSLACFVLLPRAECLWLLSGFRFLLILPLNALLKAFDLPDHSLVSDGSPGRGNSRRVTLQPKVVSTSSARSIPGSAKCLAAFELF